MPSFQTHPTPNPNSLKITTSEGAFIEDGLETFNSAKEAEGHALGERLFSVTGVENVLIMPDFLTVTKSPGASWDHLTRKVKHILAAYFEEKEGDEV